MGFLEHKDYFTVYFFPESCHLCWKLMNLLAGSICWPNATQRFLTVFSADFKCPSLWSSMTKESSNRITASHLCIGNIEGAWIQNGLGNCKTHVLLEISLATVCLYACLYSNIAYPICLCLLIDVLVTQYIFFTSYNTQIKTDCSWFILKE